MERRSSDFIADELESMILDGSLPDGERLDEMQLAQRFAVSRTPLREALQRLTLSGLVKHVPRRGVFVRHPDAVELLEMFEVMAELEAICARFAAIRITDEALDDLRATNERCQRAVDERDSDDYYRANERFHEIIYSQSGNRFLAHESHRLHRRLMPFRRLQLRLRGRLRQSMSEHETILKALENGNAKAAASAIRAHVAVQGEKFNHLMARLKSADSSLE